jgi:hypothetical protein
MPPVSGSAHVAAVTRVSDATAAVTGASGATSPAKTATRRVSSGVAKLDQNIKDDRSAIMGAEKNLADLVIKAEGRIANRFQTGEYFDYKIKKLEAEKKLLRHIEADIVARVADKKVTIETAGQKLFEDVTGEKYSINNIDNITQQNHLQYFASIIKTAIDELHDPDFRNKTPAQQEIVRVNKYIAQKQIIDPIAKLYAVDAVCSLDDNNVRELAEYHDFINNAVLATADDSNHTRLSFNDIAPRIEEISRRLLEPSPRHDFADAFFDHLTLYPLKPYEVPKQNEVPKQMPADGG